MTTIRDVVYNYVYAVPDYNEPVSTNYVKFSNFLANPAEHLDVSEYLQEKLPLSRSDRISISFFKVCDRIITLFNRIFSFNIAEASLVAEKVAQIVKPYFNRNAVPESKHYYNRGSDSEKTPVITFHPEGRPILNPDLRTLRHYADKYSATLFFVDGLPHNISELNNFAR